MVHFLLRSISCGICLAPCSHICSVLFVIVVASIGEERAGIYVVCAFELPHDKTNEMTCAPSEDSDQPGHPASLIRVFAVHMKRL